MPLKPEILAAWPPGGWEFYQPETNWHAPSPLVFNFEQQVNNIIAMRKANPRFRLSIEFMEVAKELERYTEARLHHHKKFVVDPASLDEAQKKTTQPSGRPLLSRAVGAAAEVVGVDADPLVEWLGPNPTPVSREVAERRAAGCAVCDRNSSSPKCPESERNSWVSWITMPVARALRIYIGLKNQLRLETSKDRELGKCVACKCELVLKVWTPLHHIRDNMSPEVAAKLAKVKNCWVLTEPE